MITSSSNAKLKNVTALLQKSKARREQDAFVIEGVRLCREAPQEQVLETYVSEEYLNHNCSAEDRAYLDTLPHGYEVVSADVFRRVADTQTPQGVLSVARRPHTSLEELLQVEKNSRSPLFLILEDLQDPGNLGTLLRTSEGAGVSGVIMSGGCVDLFNPKVVRATMGSIFRMPVVTGADMPSLLARLREAGVKSYAAYLDGSTDCYSEDYRGATAFLIGNEGNGLKRETAEAAAVRIRIPMGGQLESLNAAVSGAVLMYEAARQRRA